MQILTQQEFKDWLAEFDSKIIQEKSDMFLGRAFTLQFLDSGNNQLYNMQSDEEAIHYILNSYVDIEVIRKASVI